jgi:hypothetical protein
VTGRPADRACSTLQDPNVLFVVIKTKQAEAAQKAVEVASATKRHVISRSALPYQKAQHSLTSVTLSLTEHGIERDLIKIRSACISTSWKSNSNRVLRPPHLRPGGLV